MDQVSFFQLDTQGYVHQFKFEMLILFLEALW